MLNFSTLEVIVLVLLGLLLLLGYVSQDRYRKFEKTGICHLEPKPLFGNLFWAILGRQHMATIMKNIYDSFPTERYVGIFELMNPSIILKDAEVIKRVTIKDFDHFHDLAFQIDEHNDPVFGNMLLALNGKKWRQMRSAISPAFTSSKIKNMFSFINDCAIRGVAFYGEKVKENPNYEVDVKYLSTRFTTDVIASTSFGFEIDSLNHPENEFFSQSLQLTKTTVWLMLKFTGFRIFPKLMKALGMRLMPESRVAYFKNLMHDTLHQREKSGIYRPDMLHLLVQAKKGNLKHEAEEEVSTEFASSHEYVQKTKERRTEWTDDELVSQAITFLVAGQHTTSTTFSFLLYELAVNQEVQTQLWEEVSAVMADVDGELTYTAVLQMKYMDMVLSECLRKWPPLPFINRLCVQDYDLGPVRDSSDDHFTVKKGDSIWVPVYCIHMDPALWPNPGTFDPERFSQDNVHNIKPQSYLPFGSGPRNCIGSRFALLNLKVMLFHYLHKFKFEVCPKTVVPIQMATNTLFMEAKDGYWVAMKPRY